MEAYRESELRRPDTSGPAERCRIGRTTTEKGRIRGPDTSEAMAATRTRSITYIARVREAIFLTYDAPCVAHGGTGQTWKTKDGRAKKDVRGNFGCSRGTSGRRRLIRQADLVGRGGNRGRPNPKGQRLGTVNTLKPDEAQHPGIPQYVRNNSKLPTT